MGVALVVCPMAILDVKTVPSAWPTEAKKCTASGAKGADERPCSCECHMQNGCQGSTLSCVLRKLFPSRLGLMSKTPTFVAASVRGCAPEVRTRLIRASVYAGDEADMPAATRAEEGAGAGADEGLEVRERADGVAGPEVEAAGSDMRGRDYQGQALSNT